MKTGKLLAVIGGLITIFATFAMTWFEVAGVYASGIAIALGISDTFTNAATIAASWGGGVPTFVIYIVEGCYLLMLISGLLMLFGGASRALAIIGSFMPLAISIASIAGSLSPFPENVLDYISMLASDSAKWGIFPFHVPLGGVLSLGSIVLLLGGLMGLISAFFPRKD
jgi:hypothetical protein